MYKLVVNKDMYGVETDSRVNENLEHCLYCKVITTDVYKYNGRDTGIKIPLNDLDGFKQCPACKTVYFTFSFDEDSRNGVKIVKEQEEQEEQE